MKKSLLLMFVLVFVFVGCSTNKEEDNTTTVDNSNNEATETTQNNEDQEASMDADDSKESMEEKASDDMSDSETVSTDSDEILLTIEELAEYDGTDGKPAYVAIDGIIYDMTDSPAWKNGGHNGFQAGQDLTTALKEQSPHGESKLENVPAVGKIIESTSDATMEKESMDDTLKLTLEELAAYDGKDGNPAYIAYKGVIYDVSSLDGWKGGTHNGHDAGADVTEALGHAPHGEEMLERATIVGEIVE